MANANNHLQASQLPLQADSQAYLLVLTRVRTSSLKQVQPLAGMEGTLFLLPQKPQLNRLSDAVCRNDILEDAKFQGQRTEQRLRWGGCERWEMKAKGQDEHSEERELF